MCFPKRNKTVNGQNYPSPQWYRPFAILVLLALVSAGLAMGRYCLSSHRQGTSTLPVPLDAVAGRSEPPSLMTEATTQPAELSLEIFRHIVAARSAIVVDARPATLFQKGHVPGAINLSAIRPDDRATNDILKYPSNTPVIVYCESDNCTDSEEVATLLRTKGMQRVRVFPGGWQTWQAHGLEIETVR
jgi:rhodanese-related sulfurtransferase